MKKSNKISKCSTCPCREALRKLINYLEQDPDLYKGDDDGVLNKLMTSANKVIWE